MTSGCGEQTEAYVTVDNGLETPMVVEVDGEQVAKILPGKKTKLTLPLGERRFRVTSNGKTVYESTHLLSFGDRPFRRPCYMLNPDNTNRYCDVDVLYGDDSVKRGTSDLMVSLISAAASRGDDENAKARAENIKQNRLQSEYKRILNQSVAMGDEPFFEFSSHLRVIDPLPSWTTTRHSSSTTISALLRMPKEVHDALLVAKEKTEISEDDLQKAVILQRIVQDLVPIR